MSRRNTLYTKTIDYTTVEEFLDQSIDMSEGIPPSMTSSIHAVTERFQQDREYRKQSIIDAVNTYYSEKGWNPAAIRNMRVAVSNCSRDNRRKQYPTGWKMPDSQREAISRAMTGKRWKMVDGKRQYIVSD